MEKRYQTCLAEMHSSDWHADVLHARQKRIDNGKARFFTIEDARKKLLEIIE